MASSSLDRPERSKKRTASAPVSRPSESAHSTVFVRGHEERIWEALHEEAGRYMAPIKGTGDLVAEVFSDFESRNAYKVDNKVDV